MPLTSSNDTILGYFDDAKRKGLLERVVLRVITVCSYVTFIHWRNVANSTLFTLYDDTVVAVKVIIDINYVSINNSTVVTR